MDPRGEIDFVVGTVRDASASTEARFTDMGVRLGTAVDTIGTLTQTFDRLGNELAGENLRDTTRQLSQVMARITALTDVDDDKRALFDQLAGLTTIIQQQVPRMAKAVDSISMLAINTRIEAANIGDAGLDFAGFTNEIGRTLRLARTSLGQLTGELGDVGNQLRAAVASQLALARHRAEAIRSVPARLSESIGAITDRGRRAVAAASSVTQKSRQVGQNISDAVMALQIGDITRQRLEHVEAGLGIIAEVLTPPGDARRITSSDWSALSDPQRQALAGVCGALLSAQLLDAADEFDREMHQIFSSVQELATDAEDILRLGTSTVGAAGDQRGTFLGKVEEQVGEVEALLNGTAAARREADAVIGSVSEATARLVGHTTVLRSLEEDIRLMGLNMSLKCGRLGPAGLPLMVIAQELRAYSNQIATEAGTITVHLDRMMVIAGSLSDRHDDPAAHGEAVATTMADTVSRLKEAGEGLADALATLAHDTNDVAAVLRKTVARATVHEELGRVLREAAANLAGTTAVGAGQHEARTPEADRMLERVARSYTMDRERFVHQRVFPGQTGAAAAAVAIAAAPVEFEDVLF